MGSPDFVVGFKLAGVRRVHETSAETVEGIVQEVLNNREIGILIISSKDMERFPASLRSRLIDSTSPVVIPVGLDKGDMRDKVRRAIGIDLYKGE